MKRVLITCRAAAEMSRHLRSVYPREGCGVLLGKQKFHIDGALAIANVAPSGVRDRFQLDPVEYAAAEKHADASGLKVSGFFHSHPDSPPLPSQIDLDAARGLFEFAREKYLYVIQTISASGEGELRCWDFDGSEFTGLAFEIRSPEAERQYP